MTGTGLIAVKILVVGPPFLIREKLYKRQLQFLLDIIWAGCTQHSLVDPVVEQHHACIAHHQPPVA